MKHLIEIPIFAMLSDDQLHRIDEITKIVKFKKNEVIIQEREIGDNFYIIKKGRVRIIKSQGTDQEKELAILSPGDFFGEMALVEKSARAASCVADTAVELFAIDERNFNNLIKLDLSFAIKIMQVILQRTRQELEELIQSRRRGGSARRTRIISLFSPKGGQGRTAIAANLATCLKLKNPELKVLLLDLDLQFGDLPLHFSMTPAKTLFHLVKQESNLNINSIRPYISKCSSTGIELLAAPIDPVNADLINRQQIIDFVKAVYGEYDYVIIDTPSNLRDYVVYCLELSGAVILLTGLDHSSVRKVTGSLNLFREMKFDHSKLIVATNETSAHPSVRFDTLSSIFKVEPSIRIPYSPDLMSLAQSKGIPAIALEPKSPFASEMFKLAGIIADPENRPRYLVDRLLDATRMISGIFKKKKATSKISGEVDHFKEGLYLHLKGDYPGALKELESALGECREDPDYYIALAETHQALGNKYKASENYKLALDKDSENVNPGVVASLVLLLNKLNRQTEAAKFLAEALKVCPDDYNLLFAAGQFYEATDKTDKAIKAYEATLSIYERHVGSLQHLAKLLINSGNPTEAKPYLERLVNIDKGSYAGLEAASLLKSIQPDKSIQPNSAAAHQ